MVEPLDDISLPDAEADRGTTRVLTVEGWEIVPYVDPEDDWELQEDGSWVAPDGITRSWPLVGPDPA